MLNFTNFDKEHRFNLRGPLVTGTLGTVFDDSSRNDFCQLQCYVITRDSTTADLLSMISNESSGVCIQTRLNGTTDSDILTVCGLTNGGSTSFPSYSLSIADATPSTFGAGLGHKLWIGTTFKTQGTDRFETFVAWEQNDGTYFYATGVFTALTGGHRFRGGHEVTLHANQKQTSIFQYRYGHRQTLAYWGVRDHTMDYDEFEYLVEAGDPTVFNVLSSGNFNGTSGHLLSLPYVRNTSDPFLGGSVSGEVINTSAFLYTAYGSDLDLVRPTGNDTYGDYLSSRQDEPIWIPALGQFNPVNYPVVYEPSGSHVSSAFPNTLKFVNDTPSGRMKIGTFANSRGVRNAAEYSSTGVHLNGDYEGNNASFVNNNLALNESYTAGLFSLRSDNTVGETYPVYHLPRLSSTNTRKSSILFDSNNDTNTLYRSSASSLLVTNDSNVRLDQNFRRLGSNSQISSRPGPADVFIIQPNGAFDLWIHNIGQITDQSKVRFKLYFAGLPGTFGSDLKFTPIASTGFPGNSSTVNYLSTVTSGVLNTSLPLVSSGSIRNGIITGSLGSDASFPMTVSKLYSELSPSHVICATSGASSQIAMSIISSGTASAVSYPDSNPQTANFQIEHAFHKDGSDGYLGNSVSALTSEFEFKTIEIDFDPTIEGSGFLYRGLRVEQESGSFVSYLINAEIYNPDVDGWHFVSMGQGGVGVSDQYEDIFKTKNSNQQSAFDKYLELLDLDILFLCEAEQNSSPSDTVDWHDLVKGATPNTEIIWCAAPPHLNSYQQNDNSGSTWATYFIENAEANNALAVSAFNDLGRGVQQFYYNFRTDTAHFTSLGNVEIGRSWLSTLSSLLLPAKGFSALSVLKNTDFYSVHRRR